MTDPTPVVPPADPPAPVVPPDPKPAEKKLLDDLKKEQSKRKELEAKLAEALPYLEKFKTHDEAKALEAQREAEARAKQESEARNRQDVDSKKERAILRSLLGLNMPTEDAADFAFWKLANDPGIVFDPETGAFTGLTEARAKLAESPLFAGVKPPAPPVKPAPGLPVTGKPAPGGKFSGLTTFTELITMGPAAVSECFAEAPDVYARLKQSHIQGASAPTRATMPVPRSN